MNLLLDEILTEAKIADGNDKSYTNVSLNMTRNELVETAASALRLLAKDQNANITLIKLEERV